MQDSLIWIATYENGTQLCQMDKDGAKHAYDDIDRERLRSFTLCKVEDGHNIGVFRVSFTGDGKKLIWRRRVQKTAGGDELIVHIVGKKHQYVALVYQTGATEVFDNFSEENVLLNEPVYTDKEK